MDFGTSDSLSIAIKNAPGKLRTWLQENYDLEEFQDLCQDIGIKYDLLRGENLNKARSFAAELRRDQNLRQAFLSYLEENSPKKHLQILQWYMLNSVSEVAQEPSTISHSTFDVFLSYNSHDKLIIRKIYSELKQQSITPWLDEFDLPAGHWNDIFAKLLPRLKSAAIFSGRHGFGDEQKREIRAFMERQKKSPSFQIIPVILEDGTDISDTDPLLSLDVRIDFNQDIDPIGKLVGYVKEFS